MGFGIWDWNGNGIWDWDGIWDWGGIRDVNGPVLGPISDRTDRTDRSYDSYQKMIDNLFFLDISAGLKRFASALARWHLKVKVFFVSFF